MNKIGMSTLFAVVSAFACKATDPMTLSAIEARLQPVGIAQVQVDGAVLAPVVAPVATVSVGEKVYHQACVVCHGAGVAGAPKLGDKAAWAPRIAKGQETLWKHLLQGINAMPARGTCMTCTDEELKETLNWMIDQSR